MSLDQRPALHITASRGWLNDPNGLIDWHGVHHVFHQADENSIWFGTMEWGHVTSPDLRSWQRLPAALAPSQPADRDGCWTGSVVDNAGVATAVYTGVTALGNDTWHQEVCLATSTDPDLRSWTKDPDNPMTVDPPDFPVTAIRDPYVWRDGDGWAMLLGSGLPSGDGAILLYRSIDLRSWHYRGVLLAGPAVPDPDLWTGAVWECPSLVKLNGEDVITFSVCDPRATPVLHYPVTVVGRFEGDRFEPKTAARFDYGHDCYAPAVLAGDNGTATAYGWSWEALTDHGRTEQGWSGCLTLPREMTVRDGTVHYRPALAVEALRGAHWSLTNVAVGAASDGPASAEIRHEIPSRSAEIFLSIDLGTAQELTVALCESTEGVESTIIRYIPEDATITFDRTKSSEWAEARGGTATAPYRILDSRLLELRIFVDHSVLEIFVGGTVVFTERIYPQRSDSRTARVSAQGGSARVNQLDVWELNPSAVAESTGPIEGRIAVSTPS